LRIGSLLAASALASFVVLGLACGVDEPTSDGSSGDSDSSTSDTTTSATTGQGGAGGSTTATGTGGSTSTTGQGGAPPCPGLGDACTECLAWDCSDTYCGCYGNPTCGTLLTCLQTCGPNNAQCTNDCLAQNGAGISDAFLVGDCSATTCAASCAGTGFALAPCEKCLFSKCEDAMNTCLAIEDCTALIQCVQACDPGDQFCAGVCGAQYGSVIDEATAVGDCSNAQCATECAM